MSHKYRHSVSAETFGLPVIGRIAPILQPDAHARTDAALDSNLRVAAVYRIRCPGGKQCDPTLERASAAISPNLRGT